jgi:lipopolysaccharide transport system ATP-binding protein
MMQKDASQDAGIGPRLNYDPKTRITSVEFLDGKGQPCSTYESREPFRARIRYDCQRTVRNARFTIGVLSPENIGVMAHYSHYDGQVLPEIQGKGYIDFSVEELPLKPGNYTCTVTLTEDQLTNVLDWHEKGYRFSVRGTPCQGLLNLKGTWKLAEG